MKIFVANWFLSYTSDSIVQALRNMGQEVTEGMYVTPEDVYVETSEEGRMKQEVMAFGADVVFSVNIWPPAARVCRELGIPYLAWSYDSPQNLRTNQDLNYDTNFLFLFDRIEVENYRAQGISRVFHLPLATNVLDRKQIRLENKCYDVSFVGNLYESTLPALNNALSEYNRGFLQAMITAQRKVYGYFLVDDLLTDTQMNAFNRDFLSAGGDNVSVRQMAYSIGSYVTYLDRLTLLQLLSNRLETHLFTTHMSDQLRTLLSRVKMHGSVDYATEMPKVFCQSKINLNPALRIIRSGIPLRCLDIMGSGGFLLSSFQAELAEFFVPDQELVLYESMEDAVAKAMFYVAHEELREQIALRGYEKVKAEFHYSLQLKRLFETAHLKLQ